MTRTLVTVAVGTLAMLSAGAGSHGVMKGQSAQARAAVASQARAPETPSADQRVAARMKNIERYFAAMEEDVSVYDPATPWIFDGKAAWRKRVPHLNWELLDLNQFHRTEVELGDMRITTFYRELRRVEGSFVSRLHGKITFVHLKQPDGSWWLWHDHTSENKEDYSYTR